MPDFSQYQSPFSWRYASPEMRRIWSEENTRLLWRELWVLLAQAEHEFGLVSAEQLNDLRAHKGLVDIPRSLEIEQTIHHDLMAEIRVFSEQCPVGGKIIHAGATSMDIKDNSEVMQVLQAIDLVLEKLKGLIQLFCDRMIKWAETPCMAFTHLQPAELTTLGYRFSIYGLDLLFDFQNLFSLRSQLKGKGFKGAVGAAASFIELLGDENFLPFEKRLSQLLGFGFFPSTTQTYPRKQDYDVISCLSGLGISLSKFSYDLRIQQSLPFGEWQEPFSDMQVGSSAMPFKRNPIKAEKITSLARTLSVMPTVMWQNAATSFLERTLDDSANRRSIIPEAFLICDELIITATSILNGLVIDNKAIQYNLDQYLPYANTERLLMALVRSGADRQEMHAIIREHAIIAWKTPVESRVEMLIGKLCNEPIFHKFIEREAICSILNSRDYFGFAPAQSKRTAELIIEKIDLNSIP